MADKKLWVDNRHPEYSVQFDRRDFTRDQYTGDALLRAISEASGMSDEYDSAGREASQFMSEDNLPQYRTRLGYLGKGASSKDGFGRYLRRRSQGESAAAFRERANITRFPSHMPALIDAYIGGIAAVEEKWKRTWGDPLGDPMDKTSVMYGLWHDIDGTGRNWRSANNTTVKNLIVDDVVITFTYKKPGEKARTMFVDPQRVVDWHMEDGRVVWMVVVEDSLERSDFRSEAEYQRYYTEYSVDGWAKHKVIEDGDGQRRVIRVGGGKWQFPFYVSPDRKKKRLPFTIIRLSDMMGRYVGFQMAKDHNALYNILSDARWNFRIINYPRLTGDVDDDQFEKTVNGINRGMNALQGVWAYISPDSTNGSDAYRVYAEETKQFYITNHQRLNSPDIERSATEIVHNEAAGRTAFLSLLTSAADEGENDRLFLHSQIEAPNKPDSWLNCRVERSRDFKPIDIQSMIQQQTQSFAETAKILSAEQAARVAREGFTDELVKEIAQGGGDPIVTEEQ